MKTIPSKKYRLNWHDIIKGLLISIVTAILMFIQESLSAEEIVFKWKDIGMAAVGGAVAYLLKNFFSGEPVSQSNP